ncbi:MAG: SGNH/GDSL hydrolase family protein [Deltaproteobacteria bacterium]|nr:SGNH/GDSL hydrolase family protein [Deltaproteobacteria bacterium]
MSASAWSPRIDVRIFAAPAIVALAWAAGLAASVLVVPADVRGFVASALRDAVPATTILLAALWHAALLVLARPLELPRTSAHVSAAYVYVVAAAWGDGVAMAVAAAIGLADLVLASKRARRISPWLFGGLAVALFLPLAIVTMRAGIPPANAFGSALVVALVAVAVRREPLGEILRDELAVLAASALAGFAALAAMQFAVHDFVFAPVAALVAWGAHHARGLQRRQTNVRAFHAAMIFTVMAGFASVDLALAPMKILLPEAVPNPAARVADRPEGERVVPPGFFNNDGDPAGWWIQTGFFRSGPPSPDKELGTIRVVVQGSSTTACMNLDHIEEVWTHVMERSLNATNPGRPVEVVNAGIPGTTTLAMLLNLRAAILPLGPDFIVLYAGANDAAYGHGPLTQRQIYDLARAGAFERDAQEDVRVFGRADDAPSAMRVAVARHLMRSTLYRLLAARIFAVRAAQPALASLVPAVPAVPLADFARNLNEFADECARAGVRLIFVGEGVRIDIDDYKAVMKDLAAARGIPYIDAQPIFSACPGPLETLIFDTVHLTPEGSRCLGEGLAVELRTRGLLAGDTP